MVADRPQVAGLERQIAVELPLHINEPLHGVGRAAVELVRERLGRQDIGDGAGQAGSTVEPRLGGEVGIVVIAGASGGVARDIEPRVALVLVVEHAGARADRPSGGRTPGDPDARRTYVFPEPQALLTPSPKLPGTDGRKMSKSYGNSILMSDPEPLIRQKLKTMVTDPARVRRSDPGNPDVCPVGDVHKIFSSKDTLQKVYAGCRSAGIGCIECKGWAADALVSVLNPMQERRRHYEQNPREVWEVLEDGTSRASRAAEVTMEEVRAAMRMSKHYEEPVEGAAQ